MKTQKTSVVTSRVGPKFQMRPKENRALIIAHPLHLRLLAQDALASSHLFFLDE